MDAEKVLIAIVSSFATLLLRDLATAVAKQSKVFAAFLARIAVGFLRGHWRLLFVIFDLLVAIGSIYLITAFLSDKTPATKSFAALMAACAMNSVLFLIRFGEDLKSYGDQILARRKRLPEPDRRPVD